jgi:hypothetical protein
LTANNQYFICGTDNIQFGNESLNLDGSRPTININVSLYPGLIQNGAASSNGNNNISIYNLIVNLISGSFAQQAGYIGQTYFSRGVLNNIIINCSSSGPVSGSGGGGIVGSYASSFGGNLIITSCNSSGNIGTGGGGIVGGDACNNGGIITVTNCSSDTSGTTIGSFAGGIVGYNSRNITISNCYSINNISGFNAGGIVGEGANNIKVSNSYSTGAISGNNSGGIFGANASICQAINCYSSGLLSNGAEGIFGSTPTPNTNTVTNCYAANGSWNDSAASAVLQNVGWSSGKVWGSLSLNTPYVLVSFGASPYTLNNIDPATKTLVQTFSQTVQAGNATPPALAAGYKTFEIKAGGDPTITIANSPSPTGGVITTTSATPAGTYTLYIYAVDDYTTTTYTLTVTAAPIPPTPAGGAGAEITIPPCCEANICNKNPQESSYSGETIAVKKSGKTINSGVANFYNGVASGARTAYSQPVFKSYYDYMQFLQGKTR